MVFKSKAKGNAGERDVARILSYLTGIEWHRVPYSGAGATSGYNPELRGDVYCNEVTSSGESYKDLVVEVKNHKGLVSVNDLMNEGSSFNSWLTQVKRESKVPVLSQSTGHLNSNSLNWLLFFKSGGKWFWIKPQGGVWAFPQLLTALRKNSKFYYNIGLLDFPFPLSDLTKKKEEVVKND